MKNVGMNSSRKHIDNRTMSSSVLLLVAPWAKLTYTLVSPATIIGVRMP